MKKESNDLSQELVNKIKEDLNFRLEGNQYIECRRLPGGALDITTIYKDVVETLDINFPLGHHYLYDEVFSLVTDYVLDKADLPKRIRKGLGGWVLQAKWPEQGWVDLHQEDRMDDWANLEDYIEDLRKIQDYCMKDESGKLSSPKPSGYFINFDGFSLFVKGNAEVKLIRDLTTDMALVDDTEEDSMLYKCYTINPEDEK